MSELFPSVEQVERADREQLARWLCLLPSPKKENQQNIADRIVDRFLNMGGMTPGLQKRLGFQALLDFLHNLHRMTR